MRFMQRVFLLCAALLSTGVGASAATIDAERTLAIAQSVPLLRYACENVAISLGATPVRTAAADASLRALRAFVLSKRSDDVRVWCLKNARDLVNWGHASAYVADLDELEAAALTSETVDDQIVGARAAWIDLSLRTGHLIDRLARPGHNREVRIAALEHFFLPFTERSRARALRSDYDRTILLALHDRNDRIIVAGLLAYSMLHQASADALLLTYAHNDNPVLRAGVFEALFGREVIDGTDSRLFAIGLRDPDIRVRSAALIALRMPTRADLRLLATFARTAPTPQDRRNAREQMSAFRTFKPFI